MDYNRNLYKNPIYGVLKYFPGSLIITFQTQVM